MARQVNRRRAWVIGLAGGFAGTALLLAVDTQGQRTDAFVDSRDHPAIAYSSPPLRDRVSALSARLTAGAIRLTSRPDSGYLLSVLDAFDIPIESQSLVFSQTSLQASQITPATPRAVYFDSTAAVGWVPGAEQLEVAVQDPRQGVVFYTLDQHAAEPQFIRRDSCLSCHLSWESLGVPGIRPCENQR